MKQIIFTSNIRDKNIPEMMIYDCKNFDDLRFYTERVINKIDNWSWDHLNQKAKISNIKIEIKIEE